MVISIGTHLLLFGLNPGWLHGIRSPQPKKRTITFNLVKLPGQAKVAPRNSLRPNQRISGLKKKKNKDKLKGINSQKKEEPKPPVKKQEQESLSTPEIAKINDKDLEKEISKMPDLKQEQGSHNSYNEQDKDIFQNALISNVNNDMSYISSLAVPSIIPPKYKKNPSPPYPRIAKRRGYEGTVIIEALVTREGKVGDAKIIKSSGYQVLDVSALNAINNWLFEPGIRDGRVEDMWVRIPIRFKLR